MILFQETLSQLLEDTGMELLSKIEDFRFSMMFVIFDMINLGLAVRFYNDYVTNCTHMDCDDHSCRLSTLPFKDCKIIDEVSVLYKVIGLLWIASCLMRLVGMSFYSVFLTTEWRWCKFGVMFIPLMWLFVIIGAVFWIHPRNILWHSTLYITSEMSDADKTYMQHSLDKVNVYLRYTNWMLSLIWLVAICGTTSSVIDSCITIQHYTGYQVSNCTCEKDITGVENHCVDASDAFMTLISMECCVFLADLVQKVFFETTHGSGGGNRPRPVPSAEVEIVSRA